MLIDGELNQIQREREKQKNYNKYTYIVDRIFRAPGIHPPPLSKTVIWLLRQSITSFSTGLTYI